MTDLPPLTILLGPQTSVSLALNAIAREQRAVLANAGLAAWPSRLSAPLLRRCLDDRPPYERETEFATETAIRPAFMSAVNFFGPPQAGMMKGEMFPDAEKSLAGLSDIAPKARILIGIDTLPAFFLAAGSEPLEARVRRTSWEVLYDLSWADLVREIKAALPDSALIVLTPDGAGRYAEGTLRRLLGDAVDALPDRRALLRAAIADTGRAVLDRLVTEGDPPQETLAELYASFAVRPTPGNVQQRLAIDKVTAALLDQRFAEDVDAIQMLPGIEVI